MAAMGIYSSTTMMAKWESLVTDASVFLLWKASTVT